MTGQAARDRWTSFAERNADQFGFVLLLVLATYVLGSLARFRGWTGVLIGALTVFTALYALVTARARPRVLRLALVVGGLAMVAALVSAIADAPRVDGAAAFLQMLLFLGAAAAVLREVVTEERVRVGSIAGAISVYIMLSLLWAYVYVGVDLIQQRPFFGAGANVQNGDYLFFSMTTLTTTGYGDLVPAGQPGRMLAAMEMLMGQIFVVTLVARLVSMWRPGEWLRTGAGIARRRDRSDS